MNQLRFLLALAATVAIFGCAAPQQLRQSAAPLSALKQGSGRLVIFRDSGTTHPGPEIYVSGHELGRLQPRQVVELALEPGEYEIKSQSGYWIWLEPRGITVDVRDKATSYVELVVETGGGGHLMVNHYYRLRHDEGAQRLVEKFERIKPR